MRVIAKERGYYKVIREPGDEFEFAGNYKAPTWFEPVETEPKPKRAKTEKQPQPVDDLLA